MQRNGPACRLLPRRVRRSGGGRGSLLLLLLLASACGQTAAETAAGGQSAALLPDSPAVASPLATAVASPRLAEAEATVTPTIDIYLQYGEPTLVARLEAALLHPDLSAESRQRIEESIAEHKRDAERRATIMTLPRAPKPGEPGYVPPVFPTTQPRPTITPGISPARFWNKQLGEYTFNTVWHGYEPDGPVALYAGFPDQEPEQSVLVEFKNFYDDRLFQIERYDTPTQSGMVTIVAEEDGLLILEAENGDRFVFAIAGRQFVPTP